MNTRFYASRRKQLEDIVKSNPDQLVRVETYIKAIDALKLFQLSHTTNRSDAASFAIEYTLSNHVWDVDSSDVFKERLKKINIVGKNIRPGSHNLRC